MHVPVVSVPVVSVRRFVKHTLCYSKELKCEPTFVAT